MIRLQLVRGTTAENDAYTGLAGQLSVDEQRWELRLHDGVTQGGHRILNLSQLYELFLSIDSEFGEVDFDEDDRGYLVRVGHRTYVVRSIEGVHTGEDGPGIYVENGDAVDGPTEISVVFPAGPDLTNITASGLRFVGNTAGTASKFTLTAEQVTNWDLSKDGLGFLFRFHAAPNQNATLKIGATAEVPLYSAHENRLVNRTVFAAGTIALLYMVDQKYYLIGLNHPSEIGINPIAEMEYDNGDPINNVQDALEWLKDNLGNTTIIEAGPGNPFEDPVKYGPFTDYTNSGAPITQADCTEIADGGVMMFALTWDNFPYRQIAAIHIGKDKNNNYWWSTRDVEADIEWPQTGSNQIEREYAPSHPGHVAWGNGVGPIEDRYEPDKGYVVDQPWVKLGPGPFSVTIPRKTGQSAKMQAKTAKGVVVSGTRPFW